jgi:mannose-6-phosphate isomerase-like protein (cupin superfamily)
MPDRYTLINLDAVEDAAVANGLGHRWEARVAREDLGCERTGLTHFRLRPGKRSPFVHRHRKAEEIYVILAGGGWIKLDEEIRAVAPGEAIRIGPAVARAFEAGPDGLEFIASGPHVAGDGEPVEDPWVD